MTADQAPQGLGRRAVRGVAVTAVAQLTRMALQIVSVVILARLLTPRDYGLVAMVLAIVGIAELFRDLGLSPAAVRAESLSIRERDNLFWLNTCLGGGLGLLVVATAPLIAWAYGRPELTAIAIAIAPTYLMSGFSTQYRVDLTRQLRFGALAAVDLTCAAIPLVVGVLAATLGAHYWALVIQQLSSGLLGCVLLVAVCRWRPARYDRRTPVAHFVRLGLSFVFGGVMAYITRNADNVIVGHQFGASSLGLYTRSVQLVRTPLAQLQAPFGTVAFPVLAAAGDDDARLMSAARRAQTALLYPVIAGVAIIVAAAPAVVQVALGDQWSDAAPIMAWVAVSGGLTCLVMPALWIFGARGLARAITHFNAAATVLALAAMLIGVNWGVEGMAAGIAGAQLVVWPLALWFLAADGGLDPGPLAWTGVRVGAIGSTASILGHLSTGWAVSSRPVAEILMVAGVVALSFLAAASLPVYRRDYRDVIAMVGLLRRASDDS